MKLITKLNIKNTSVVQAYSLDSMFYNFMINEIEIKMRYNVIFVNLLSSYLEVLISLVSIIYF